MAGSNTAAGLSEDSVTAVSRRKWLWPSVAALTSLLAIVFLFEWLTPALPEPRPLVHFVTPTPQGIYTFPLALSPDGTMVAYVGIRDARIFLRRLEDPEAKPVPGTEGAMFPVFSPDGTSLAFFTNAGAPFDLKRVPVSGGVAITLASNPSNGPISWGPDGFLLLGGVSLLRVPEDGGDRVEVATADPANGEVALNAPQSLPGGDSILTNVFTGSGRTTDFRVLVLDAKMGERQKVLLESAGETHFVPSGSRPELGHLMFGRNGSLFAAPFTAETLEVGQAVQVWEDIQSLGGLSPQGYSAAGVLAYPTGNGQLPGLSTISWVDRGGAEQPAVAEAGLYNAPRISPDGGRVVYAQFRNEDSLESRIWVHNLARGTSTPLTFEPSIAPVWMPDGRQVIISLATNFVAGIGKLAIMPADGSGPPVPLMDDRTSPYPTSISPDGELVLGVDNNNVPSSTGSWVFGLDSNADSAGIGPFLDDRFVRGEYRFSPDGNWVAYQSNESGRNEIYVVPYPGPGAKTQISSAGGTQPRWNPNRGELFFRQEDELVAVDVQLGETFSAGTSRVLFAEDFNDYDVAPDGQRFLMLKPVGGSASSSELHIVLNWFDDLRRKAPLPE